MKKFIALILSVTLLISAACVSIIVKADELSEKITDTSDFARSSIELCENMLVGYNIGNVFESTELRNAYNRPANITDMVDYKQTMWGNVPITENYIQYLKSLGIQAVRLPVTWFPMLELNGEIAPKDTWYGDLETRMDYWHNGTINAAYLTRIKQVVDWIIGNDMYCIINTHHDAACNNSSAVNPIKLDEEHRDQTYGYLENIWQQVGTYFKDYGSSLLFEFYNEATDQSGQMSPNTARDTFTSALLENLIALIRAQGSNNTDRFLVCPRYGGIANWQSVPFAASDTATDKIIITKHSYNQTPANVESALYDSMTVRNNLQIGCIIDEIGCDGSICPYSDRGISILAAIRQYSDQYKISCFYWDSDASYSILNRYYCTPVSAAAVGAYVGKNLGNDQIFIDIADMADANQPNWIKLFTPDENSDWAGKYLIICSQNKIERLNKSGSSYTLSGSDIGMVTYYTSDDGVNFTRLMTFIQTEWCRIAWGTFGVHGATANTDRIDGNYYIIKNYYFVSDFQMQSDVTLSIEDDWTITKAYCASLTAGQTVTATTNANIEAGDYSLIFYSRSYPGRARVDIKVNGVTVAQNLDTGTKNGSCQPFELDDITITQTGALTMTFTATSSGSFWMDYISLERKGDASPVEPTSAPTTSATVPTASTVPTTTTASTTSDDTAFAELISNAAASKTITLDKNYLLTVPAIIPSGGYTLNLNGYTITYSPAEGYINQSCIQLSSGQLSLQNILVDLADAGNYPDGMMVNNSNAAFFKTPTLYLEKSTHVYGNTNIFGDITVDGSISSTNLKEYNIYGDVRCTGSCNYRFHGINQYGNIECSYFRFSDCQKMSLFGYLRTTSTNASQYTTLGIMNVYAQLDYSASSTNNGYGQVINFGSSYTDPVTNQTVQADSYKGYSFYCAGKATMDFGGQRDTLNTASGRNMCAKDLYIGGDFVIQWFGKTPLGFLGKVDVGGNITVTNYDTNTVSAPADITFANLNLINADTAALKITDNQYSDADNSISYYPAATAVTISPYAELKNVNLNIQMRSGASMRYNIVSGMRYYTAFDKQVIAALKSAGAVISFGTLIAPADLLGADELTKELDESVFSDCKYNADGYYSEDGFEGIVGSIGNVKDANAKRSFVGRGYVTINFNGTVKTLYAAYAGNNIANNTRQIGWIASEIKNDRAEYDLLTPAKKAVVDKYYNLFVN